MNQGYSSATITQAQQAQSITPIGKKRNVIPKPSQRADGTWSIRARRLGTDIYLSGFPAAHDARRAMADRLREISQRSLPYGQGPDRTTVGEAMQKYALQYLPRLRGAAQEARRINRYLRAAQLATIEVCPMDSPKVPPSGAAVGRCFAVWLAPHDNQRGPSWKLKDDSNRLLTGTTRVGGVRAALASQAMAKVTRWDVQDLACAMQAEGLARATVLREVHLLRRLFNCAARDWHWPARAGNPAVGVKVAGTTNRRGRLMSPQEQQRFDEAARVARNRMVGPASAFLAETGMRVGECINSARWEHVDWDRCILRLPSWRWGSRSLPLSPRAMDILRELRLQAAPEDKVFPITIESLKRHWRRLCESADIKDLRIGDLRRTAAVRLLDRSGDVLAMLEVAGFRLALGSQRVSPLLNPGAVASTWNERLPQAA